MVRVGIIGLGFMGATHIRAWQACAGARLGAICNPSGRHLDGDLTAVSGNLGTDGPLRLDMAELRAYSDYAAMLADPAIDVIDICTPTMTHCDLAMRALAAGKHVLCEKPMARTAAEAVAMVAAAAAAERILMPAMCLRFWPEWAWLKEAIVSGRYGRVLSARLTRIAEAPGWGESFFLDGEKSGGALLDLHIHDSDFVQYAFGLPSAVASVGYSKVSGHVDHVMTRYEVACGAIVHAEGSWAMAKGFGFQMGYVVNFENATADYQSARGEEALQLAFGGEKSTIKCDGVGGHQAQVQHLVDAIAMGGQPTMVTAGEGLTALRICEAEQRSVACGALVKL
jgi:predicted dehydrogenase